MDQSCEVYGIVLFSKIGFIFSLIPLLFLTFNMQSFFESLKHIFKFRPKITQEKKYSFLLFYSFSILVFYSTKPKPQKLALCHDLNVQLFVTPWAVVRQPPLSMGFSGQQYRSGLPCPPPGDLPDLGKISYFSCIAGGFFNLRATWEVPE